MAAVPTTVRIVQKPELILSSVLTLEISLADLWILRWLKRSNLYLSNFTKARFSHVYIGALFAKHYKQNTGPVHIY